MGIRITGTTGKIFNSTDSSEKFSGSAGNDIFIYTLDTTNPTQDIYNGRAGSDTLKLQLSHQQWIDPNVQNQFTRYLEWSSTMTKNAKGKFGSGSDFIFDFGNLITLKIQMIEALVVLVDITGNGDYKAQDLINDAVTSIDDTAVCSTTDVVIDVLANDVAPDLKKSLEFSNSTEPTLTLTYGTASLVKPNPLNATTWYFKYTLKADDPDYVALGKDITAEDNFSYILTDADGSIGTAQVKVMVTGVYGHSATILDVTYDNKDDFKGVVTEAGINHGGTATASGKLTVTDVDKDESSFQAVMAVNQARSKNAYGTYSITAEGAWTYTLDNENAKVGALASGNVLTDTFIVSSLDGTANKAVTITIQGADDLANADVLWVSSGIDVTLSNELLLKNDLYADNKGVFEVSFIENDKFPDSLTINDDSTFSFYSGDSGGTVKDPISYTFTYNLTNTSLLQAATAMVTVNVVGVTAIDANNIELHSKTYAGAYLVGGKGADDFSGGEGADDFFGGEGNDYLSGWGGDDRLFGEDGADELFGGDGDDRLFGGDGDDRLFGGDGDDKLYGGNGNDKLSGGIGVDYFLLRPDGSIDTVEDSGLFVEDKIVLSKSDFGAEVTLSSAKEDGKIFYEPNTGQLFFGGQQIALIGTDEHPLSLTNAFLFTD